MSKRPRAPQRAAPRSRAPAVEVIDLLADSSSGEEEGAACGVAAAQPAARSSVAPAAPQGRQPGEPTALQRPPPQQPDAYVKEELEDNLEDPAAERDQPCVVISSASEDEGEDWQPSSRANGRSKHAPPPRKRLRRLVQQLGSADDDAHVVPAASTAAGSGRGAASGELATAAAAKGPSRGLAAGVRAAGVRAGKGREVGGGATQQLLPFVSVGKTSSGGGGGAASVAAAVAAAPASASPGAAAGRGKSGSSRQLLALRPVLTLTQAANGSTQQQQQQRANAGAAVGSWAAIGTAARARGNGPVLAPAPAIASAVQACGASPGSPQHGSQPGSQPLSQAASHSQLLLVPTSQRPPLAAAAGGRAVGPGSTTAAAATAETAPKPPRSGSGGALAPAKAAPVPVLAVSTQRQGGLGSAPASAAPSSGPDLWCDRYAPRCEDDLTYIIHRKKVMEIKDWLLGQRQAMEQRAAAVAVPGGAPGGLASQRLRGGGNMGNYGGACSSSGYNVAVLTGPSGCGKSSCVQVLAAQMGMEVVEWTPPAPTLWNETQYQGSSGLGWQPYVSKLDDFEGFVSRAKYPALRMAPTAPTTRALHTSSSMGSIRISPSQAAAAGSSGSSSSLVRRKLLLLDDLPYATDAERRRRLVTALQELSVCSRCPVVIIATESEGSAGGGGGGGFRGGEVMGARGLHKDILSALQAAGAATISFNALTSNNIAKLLLKVAGQEGVTLAPTAALALAEAADGDARSALQALQMAAALQHSELSAAGGSGTQPAAAGAAAKKGRGKKASAAVASAKPRTGGAGAATSLRGSRQEALSASELARVAAVQRDLGLGLFHALGKLLYNKRDKAGGAEGTEEGGEDGGGAAGAAGGGRGGGESKEKDSMVAVQLRRHALQAGRRWMLPHGTGITLRASYRRPPMRYDPEAIVVRSGLEAPALVAFLHENWPAFVEGEGAEEDAMQLAAYLSDAALLSGGSRASGLAATAASYQSSQWWEDTPGTSSIAAVAASSVAARALLYTNQHPAPRRWTPLRAPACGAIDQAACGNAREVRACAARLVGAGVGPDGVRAGALWGCAQELVHNTLPWLRLLPGTSVHHAWLARVLPSTWSYYWEGAVREGAFLRCAVEQLPTGAVGGDVAAAAAADVAGSLEQLGIEEDVIEED